MQLNQQKLNLIKKIFVSKLSAAELKQVDEKTKEIINRRQTKK